MDLRIIGAGFYLLHPLPTPEATALLSLPLWVVNHNNFNLLLALVFAHEEVTKKHLGNWSAAALEKAIEPLN